VGFAKPEDDLKEDMDKIVTFIDSILSVAGFIMGLLSQLIAAMIHPQWTSWAILWLDWSNWETGVLKNMWILVSNVVYFIFALIFVSIAFLTIYRWESYQLKESLPRFIAGVLMVPFSWFFVQFVISISSLLTFSILALPFETFHDQTNDLLDKKICNLHIFNVNTWTQIDKTGKEVTQNGACPDGHKKSLRELISDKYPMAGIMSIYTTQVVSVENATRLKTKDGGVPKKIADIVLTMTFDSIFIIVYVVIIVMLALALLVRGVYMWIYAMGAPFFGILVFFKDMKSERFNLMNFLHLAMMPVYVWWVLAFWLVFIFVAWKSLDKTNPNAAASRANAEAIQKELLDIKPITSEEIKKLWITWVGDTPQGMKVTSGGDKGISVVFIWADQSAFPKGEWLFAGVDNTIWVFIIRLFGVVFLWIGLIMALEKWGKVTETVVAPFKSLWDSVWKMLAQAPINMPFIPTGMKGPDGKPISLSIAGAANMWSTIAGRIAQESWNIWSRIWWEIADKLLGNDANKSVMDRIAAMKIWETDIAAQWKAQKEILRNFDLERFKTESAYRASTISALKSAHLKIDEDALKTATTSEQVAQLFHTAKMKREDGTGQADIGLIRQQVGGDVKKQTPSWTPSPAWTTLSVWIWGKVTNLKIDSSKRTVTWWTKDVTFPSDKNNIKWIAQQLSDIGIDATDNIAIANILNSVYNVWHGISNVTKWDAAWKTIWNI